MRAGKLNKKANLLRLMKVEDSLGGAKEDWQTILTGFWVGFIGLKGGERASAIGQQSVMTGTIFMRYSQVTKDISIGDIIEVENVKYEAIAPAVNESLSNETITVAVTVYKP
jgi:head-tail adaptor